MQFNLEPTEKEAEFIESLKGTLDFKWVEKYGFTLNPSIFESDEKERKLTIEASKMDSKGEVLFVKHLGFEDLFGFQQAISMMYEAVLQNKTLITEEEVKEYYGQFKEVDNV